jgi:O-glycosyl hydrolase
MPKKGNTSRCARPWSPPHDSSSSDDIDEDYAEFLKTYVPEEDIDEDYAEFLKTYVPKDEYPPVPLSKDEESVAPMDSKASTYSPTKS